MTRSGLFLQAGVSPPSRFLFSSGVFCEVSVSFRSRERPVNVQAEVGENIHAFLLVETFMHFNIFNFSTYHLLMYSRFWWVSKINVAPGRNRVVNRS